MTTAYDAETGLVQINLLDDGLSVSRPEAVAALQQTPCAGSAIITIAAGALDAVDAVDAFAAGRA